MMKRLLAGLMLLAGGGVGAVRAAGPGDEVIIVYNTRVPESREVASYYAERRQVPASQIYGFPLSTNEEMSRVEYRSALAEPLARKLKEQKRWEIGPCIISATTNQPGLSRGDQSRRELDRMHDLLRRVFPLDDILVCPHEAADQCPCRKPKPGLLLEAAFKWQVDLDQSFVVSDKWPDAEMARAAGCTSLLLQSPWLGDARRDFTLPSLEAIVAKILALRAQPSALAVQS